MKAIVINLEHRHDRMAAIAGQLDSYGIEWERFEAIKGPDNPYLSNGHYGCFLSHKAILERGKACFVLEDDAMLCDNFKQRMDNIITRNAFVNMDMLYLGGWKQTVRKFNNDLQHADRVLTTHAYIIVDGKFCKNLLTQMETPDKIDMCFARTEGKKYITNPVLVTQAQGYSDIEHEFTDNKHLHE